MIILYYQSYDLTRGIADIKGGAEKKQGRVKIEGKATWVTYPKSQKSRFYKVGNSNVLNIPLETYTTKLQMSVCKLNDKELCRLNTGV